MKIFTQALYERVDNLLQPIRRNTLIRIGLWPTFAEIWIASPGFIQPEKQGEI